MNDGTSKGSPFSLTSDHIDTYEREGVVVLKQPFGKLWVKGLASGMAAAVNSMLDDQRSRPTWALSGRLEIYNSVMRDPFVRRFIDESSAGELCAQLSRSESVRFYFDVTFCKFPTRNGQGLEAPTSYHHDISAFGFKGRQLPSLWLALNDITLDDAPLIVAIGSHRRVRTFFRSSGKHVPLQPIPGYLDHSEIHKFLCDERLEMRTVPVQKGDAIVIHPYVIHGSVPLGSSSAFRMAFCSRWMGDDVRWRPSPYTIAEEKTQAYCLEDGAKPPNEWFPIGWSRTFQCD